ncbi:hypothetical protein BBK14_28675 [Parafrankia soli]|uniref:Uncharacterized protein n=1 Tax=Parafrankia soli TaxID=2599596 RepID=A0A1S1PGN7_9ACTN|nr:hypothetical protein [Parafrankia soli]OHV19772.1 hypothetical protein BBK14_28675 [Parafrankia soli]
MPSEGRAISGTIAGDRLLDLLESGWRRELRAGAVAGRLEAEPGLAQAVATALGAQSRALRAGGVAQRWPACVVVGIARAAAGSDPTAFWPAWRRAAGLRSSARSAREWGDAFLAALGALGLPAAPTVKAAVLAHATAPEDHAGSEGDLSDGVGQARLDPFGGGVLLTDGLAGQARAALPEEITAGSATLLAFDEDGALVNGALPADAVWVLCPAGAELRSDAPVRTLVTSTLPLAWRGWRLIQVDLRGACWIALGDNADADASRRLVRGRTRPVLRTGPPIPGVTTVAGRPVLASPPEVLLPPGQATFRVEARRTDSGAALASVTTTGDTWRPDVLWRGVRRPLLGEFVISVIPGLRRTVVLAEGLGVTSYPAPRLTSARGLQPAEAVISAPPGMTVSPAAAAYQEETVTREVTCVAGAVVQRLAVTPPHLRLRIDPEPGSGAEGTGWHHAGPLRLTHDDLWRGGLLRIDLPGAATPPAIMVMAGGEPVQVLGALRDGRYPLRRILDTAAVHGDTELTITVDEGTVVTFATVTGASPANDPWTVAQA